jgi:hypothetical protein
MARDVAVVVDVSACRCVLLLFVQNVGVTHTGQVRPEARVAEPPSQQVAHFSRVAESRVAAPRLSATQSTLKSSP